MTQNSVNATSRLSQFVYTNSNSVFTSTTQTPADNTIPQSTEGTEVFTLSITPISASSTLVITFNACGIADGTNASAGTAALFQDSTANALSAIYLRSSEYCFVLQHVMTSGTTSSTTFKIRVGKNNSGGTGAYYLNANNAGSRLMGGTSYYTLTIEEYL